MGSHKMDLFKKKPTVQQQVKTNERELRKVDRDVERDRRGLEREEKKLEMEIKKAAKQGNKQAATVLAKQLIQMRKQKTRTYVVQSQIRGANSQSKVMGANVKLAKTMQEFEMANAKMEMTEETMNDALDDILTESGDEEEEQAVISQVLDEIGIEIAAKVSDAPSAPKNKVGTKTATLSPEDKGIEAMLAQLKA